MLRTKRYEDGFTLVELIVVITLIPLIIAAFISTLYGIVNDGQQQTFQLKLDEDARDAIHSIEQDIRTGTSFAASIPTTFTDPYGPDNAGTAWSFSGSSVSSRSLLIMGLATTASNQSQNRTPIYVDGPVYNCTTEIGLNPILPVMTIYFVRDRVLYRRILTDTTSIVCGGVMSQKQSCPIELMGSWNIVCRARDEVRARNVSSLQIDYYRERQTTPEAGVYADPSAENMALLDDAEVTLTLTGTGGNQGRTTTQKLRIARLNKL